MNNSAFDSWYNGMVGFHINSERIHEDLFCFDSSPEEKAEMLRKWMAVCWNNAIDAALNEAQDYPWETRPEVCRVLCEMTLKEKI